MAQDLNELAAEVRRAGHEAAIDPADREHYARTLIEFSDALFAAHEYQDAATASADAMKLLARLAERGEGSTMDLGAAMRRHADCLVELDQMDLALDLYHQTVGLFGAFSRDDEPAQAEFAGTLLNFGAALVRARQPEDALDPFDKARELFGILGFADQGDPTLLPSLALAQVNRAKALAALGRGDEALRAIAEAETIHGEFANAMSDLHGLALADTLDARAGILRSLGRFDEAVGPAREAVRVASRLAKSDSVQFIHPLSRLTNNLGRSLQQAGRVAEAEPMFARAEEGFRILAQARPSAHRETHLRLASNHALVLAQCGRLGDAYQRAAETLGLARQDDGSRELVLGALYFMAELAVDLERPEDAAQHLRDGIERLDAWLEEQAGDAQLVSARQRFVVLLERIGDDRSPAT